jgi:hypothetical protein
MKHQKSCGPHFGKLEHQLPGVVTFAYDQCFMRVIVLRTKHQYSIEKPQEKYSTP